MKVQQFGLRYGTSTAQLQ